MPNQQGPSPHGRYSARQMETGISVPEHDYISLSNNSDGNPTQVVYRTGGSSGTIVGTVVMTYNSTSGFLETVSKTQ
tara:strand:- start:1787 stop:2017 length:231 start_codon:yes stop_codon:yes gene_type:complete